MTDKNAEQKRERKHTVIWNIVQVIIGFFVHFIGLAFFG